MYRSSKGLAIGSTVLVALVTLIDLWRAALAFSASDTYTEAARNGVPAEQVFTGYDISVLALLPALLAAYVVSCLWLWRARHNAEALYPLPHTRSRGWIWGGWLVPIVAYWFPFQVVRDIREATKFGFGPNASIGWWWATWLIYLQSMGIGGAFVPTTGQLSTDSNLMGQAEALHATAAVAACVLWCLVVRTIVREQERAAWEAYARAGATGPADRPPLYGTR